jgi:N-acetyltransferase 10
MAVLQDFEALTPNLLARTIETVEGGGLVILLVSNLTSLTQLYSVTMDMHSRLKTESHQEVTGRFNERLVLSLASCPHCLMMDDELNILPTSSLIRQVEPVAINPEDGLPFNDPGRVAKAELKELADSLSDTQPAGGLISKCRTLDQAKAVITFLDAASEKTLRSTVALTASRGRGKVSSLISLATGWPASRLLI